jgi:hypothetical protein
MARIEITENQIHGDNLYYVQNSLGEIFNHADCSLQRISCGDRESLLVNCPEYYLDIVKAEICDKVAEIVAIKYKYDYFKANIRLGGLSEGEKEILLVSLIAADLEDDKKYCLDRFKETSNISIDGVYNFRLQLLKKKWEEVVSYIPNCFFSEQVKDFITYLLEQRKKRVYVENGKIYDAHYRRLKRTRLIEYEKLNIVREIILSNCGEVEISGSIPEEDEKYLKEFYGTKIIFSNGYFS